jgi:hypothetical protein
MKQEISKQLSSIEKEYSVKIILACESGSRAWGFPSNDSDYDVRFIYVNKTDWYLSIVEKRDIIELPIDDVLDINGWDLKKSLHLMRKSNSPLLEWLSSPIQYHVWQQAFDRLLTLSRTAFMPATSCYHYLSMAKKSIEKAEGSERVKLKTYMYSIRPILCCEWIIRNLTQPPMHIADLLASITEKTPFKDKVIDLIKKKNEHSERYSVERSEVIENYINNKIVELQDYIPKNPQRPGMDVFDDVFRYILSKSRI